MTDNPKQKRVFIFLDTMPQRQGSGASLRYYSNVQAYLDLGFAVEVVQIANTADNSEASSDLDPVVWQRLIRPAPAPSLIGRVFFRAGIANRSSTAYYFPKHQLVQEAVELRRGQFPEAIYHFEGESIANVIPWLPAELRSIWSLHDLPSTVAAATTRIACEVQGRGPSVPERRELRFAQAVECYLARRTPLILCIAQTDSDLIRERCGVQDIHYLPMSIPGDGADRKTGWLQNGQLRILHLGRISHLPSFRSLEFLFEKVFPLMSSQLLDRIAMDVVGRNDEGDDRARRILRLAEPYRNVVFRGFVDDVVPFYENTDVQVVGSTDASGLRTRTIESFAYGLPVISTEVGARGIAGLNPGEHLMIANEPEEFVRAFSDLMDSPALLDQLSHNGRKFYLQHQSRAAVAQSLQGFLQKYFGELGAPVSQGDS